MLRRDRDPKQRSFADQARAMRAVPEEHLLMRMKRAADWNAIDDMLAGYYSLVEGRMGYPPALLVRMLVIEQYADLSDREAHEQVGYNLLYRTFVGLGADDAVPDDTTLVIFRRRIGAEGVRQVFDLMNRQWEAAGLIAGERRVIDGVHLWAKVARRSWASLMRQGRELIVEAVTCVDATRGEALRAEFVSATSDPELHGEEALRWERKQTERLLAAVADMGDARVCERARLVAGLLRDGDRPVSFDDPDARWGHKSEDKPFCGYKAHEAIDPDSRMITSVDVVPGNANEAVKTDELLAQETTTLKEGAPIIGDGLYNNATTVAQVEKAGATPCFSGLKAERVSDAFTYDAAADQMVCPEDKRSIGKVRNKQGDLYYFSTKDCGVCPRRDDCLTPGEREGKAQPRRRVYLSDVRKKKVMAGEAGGSFRKAQLRVRSRIEAKFDEQMNRHGLRHARYWGLAKVTAQVLLNAIAVNLKRAARLLARRTAAPPGSGRGLPTAVEVAT
ncbi:MAG: transposase [Verrucomicrobia bacterium]|nr:transposase [Verrucomicrobiota bacterium]